MCGYGQKVSEHLTYEGGKMEQKSQLLYKDQFNKREYSIMMKREHHGKTFKEIGEMFGISRNRVSQIYHKTKNKQVSLYLWAIDNANGKASYHLRERAFSLSDEYGSSIYAVAYLEDKYKDILIKFRNGEPPSPYKCPQINSDYYRQYVVKTVFTDSPISGNDRLTHEIEPVRGYEIQLHLYRTKLNEFELLVLREKGERKKGYKEIAEQLNITKALARDTYTSACRVHLHMKLAVIKEKTGKTFSELYDELDGFNVKNYLKPFEYIDKTYKDIFIVDNNKQT